MLNIAELLGQEVSQVRKQGKGWVIDFGVLEEHREPGVFEGQITLDLSAHPWTVKFPSKPRRVKTTEGSKPGPQRRALTRLVGGMVTGAVLTTQGCVSLLLNNGAMVEYEEPNAFVRIAAK